MGYGETQISHPVDVTFPLLGLSYEILDQLIVAAYDLDNSRETVAETLSIRLVPRSCQKTHIECIHIEVADEEFSSIGIAFQP